MFERALYLRSNNLANLQAGSNAIKGNQLKASISNKPGKSKEESTVKFECHDNHIDIQFCIEGKEQIGWKPRRSCSQLKDEYNSEKNVTFYRDSPDMYFQLTNGQFAIFFPEDVHAPMIGEEDIKKIVIKVKI